MRDVIKEDLISVLGQALEMIKSKELPVQDLKELSNHVIHDASIFQDDDSVSIAVLIYALSNVIPYCEEQRIKYGVLVSSLQKAYTAITANDYAKYRATIKQMFNQIKKIDEKLKIYVQEVLDRARIKKGSKLHAHGISIARTAEILGLTQWELQNYIGKQGYFDIKEMPVRQRLKTAREAFK
ncbi:hypothetical protein KY333_03310 [Candidatus Woesearchaeota archaeon]|nr:hypothetical protein [Candidatus Woesearchaeota archaeon]MBW2993969.1 hypothetical protein [Candidatus Woesearchaeota archaeon]